MAPPKRRAELGTAAAIDEDLHFARDAGGIARADTDRLQGTIAMLTFADADPDIVIANARDVLVARTTRVCRSFPASFPNDPCARAAATSTSDILLQPLSSMEKARTFRRRALADNSCLLTDDGLRKREDVLIRHIAGAVWEELTARRTGLGPQTHEEMILKMLPVVQGGHKYLHDLLMRLYPQEAIQPSELLEELIGVVVYWLAAVQWYSRALLVLLQRPIAVTPSDFALGAFAQELLVHPFPIGKDREIVAEVFTSHRSDDEPLIQAILRHPDGYGVIARVREWLSSCRSTCAYHRTRNLGLLCKPHLVATYLELFEEGVASQTSGSLSEQLAEEIGPLSIPDFMRQ